MILGFNHNVNYKGEVFHVQTEDSGVSSPNITTLLYKGGVILCSKKTSYADILRMNDLETVVEELMKEQHKEIMRRLKSGEFDERAFSVPASTFENFEIPSPSPASEPDVRQATVEMERQSGLSKTGTSQISQESVLKQALQAVRQSAGSEAAISLDDAVAAFFQSRHKAGG